MAIQRIDFGHKKIPGNRDFTGSEMGFEPTTLRTTI
jgi:hypothetical protein